MRITVYAKTGTIPSGRLVQLTGKTLPGTSAASPDEAGLAYEVDLPGPKLKPHAIVEAHPKGAIGPAPQFGFAQALGPVVEIEVSSAVAVLDDLSTTTDGKAKRAGAGDRRAVGVSLSDAGPGKRARMMLRWGRP